MTIMGIHPHDDGAHPEPPIRLVDSKAICKHLGLNRGRLQFYLKRTDNPIPHMQLGGPGSVTRFVMSEVDAWAATNVVRPSVPLTSERRLALNRRIERQTGRARRAARNAV